MGILEGLIISVFSALVLKIMADTDQSIKESTKAIHLLSNEVIKNQVALSHHIKATEENNREMKEKFDDEREMTQLKLDLIWANMPAKKVQEC